MPLPLARSLFLALCLAAPAGAAPQKAPAKKSVAKKPTTQLTTEARVVQALTRMVSAYKKMGNYTLTSSDTVKANGLSLYNTATANFARDGRRSVQLQVRLDSAGSPDFEAFRLYDGKQMRQFTLNRMRGKESTRVFNAAQLKRDPTLLERFFSLLPGLSTFSSLEEEGLGLEMKPGLAFSLRESGKGVTEIRIRYSGKSKRRAKGIDDISMVLVIGADGFLQRVEGKEAQRGSGKIDFYANSFLSRPQPLDTRTAFNWEAMRSPDPLIIGQDPIPPVVPEKGVMPEIVIE